MKISVFDKVTIPRNKLEKKTLAKYSSNPYLPIIDDVDSTEELIGVITNRGWSPFVFNEYRNQKGFVSTDFLVLDIDDGLTIQDALKRVQELGYYCVCLPTTSHTKELNKYRLIFLCEKTITSVSEFKETMTLLYASFPEADASCITDHSRFYFPCTFSDEGFIFNGNLARVVAPKVKKKRSKSSKLVPIDPSMKIDIDNLYSDDRKYIPESVDYFIKNASTGMEGEWITALNSFVFTLSLQGLSYESIHSIVDMLAPDELDSRDEDCIDRAYKDGQDEREDEIGVVNE